MKTNLKFYLALFQRYSNDDQQTKGSLFQQMKQDIELIKSFGTKAGFKNN